ncbi:hypothetical protein DOY81_009785 [Sarcophaga bullata]|nr:hypothetical protein DOY81_009785 [Sarcophaga bullata]
MDELDGEFFKHTRMCCNVFKLLLALIGRKLKKPRQRVGPEQRLLEKPKSCRLMVQHSDLAKGPVAVRKC